MNENTEEENLQEYKKTVIESITKYVDGKLATCSAGTPFLLTIVTTLLAFFFTQNYYATEEVYNAVVYIVAYLLISFICILLVYIPKGYYGEDRKSIKSLSKKPVKDFYPFCINTYMSLSMEMFIKEIEDHFGVQFSKAETIELHLLKEKINEYRIKKRFLNMAYVIILVGAVLLLIGFVIKMFTIVEGML